MKSCAFCGCRTTEVLNFGSAALAGAFLRPEKFSTEKCYPMGLHFCAECFAVQIHERIDRKTLFENYFYFTSAIGTMRNHFRRYASEVVDRFKPNDVLEIGCNDGVLLKPLADLGVNVIGVDPAANVTSTINDSRVTVRSEFFGPDTVKAVGKVDMVLANNVFAHICKINETTAQIAEILLDDGVFIFEVNRLDSLIADLQYDWIYHEHLFYYSQISLSKHLARHGLEIFDCKQLSTHAGSMRYYAGKTGRRAESKSVIRQRAHELWMGLDNPERFKRFASEVLIHSAEFKRLIVETKNQGKRIAGYGACGRTNTLLQFCGLNSDHIDYIVDDAPAKHGFYTPGTHVPIVSRETLDSNPPDVLIVFAWSFLAEIQPKLRKFKGRVITPLPSIYTHREAA